VLADDPGAAEAYARDVLASGVLPGVDLRAVRTTYIDAGIMNYVYRVEAGGRTFYLKQALPVVKEHGRLGPDLAGVSSARIRVEWRALSHLQEALPADLRSHIPRASWYDAESNILWTEEVAPGARSLQGALQGGDFDAGAARSAGRLLGAVHAAGVGEVPPLWSSAGEDRANWERFLRMRTTGFLERAQLPPEPERAVRALHAEGEEHTRSRMLSHLDAAPKNVLIEGDGSAALLDFELGAAVSDPAYDPGFLIGHYLLMGENVVSMRQAAREAAGAVCGGYVSAAPSIDAEWHTRVWRYAGATMLYRLYGSSPASYLEPGRYGVIREEGIRLVTCRTRAS
jgi:hypothetical protein